MGDHEPDQWLQQVLARAGRGDADAWRGLVEAYSPRVYGLILRQCGDRELAEEITQDTFVTVVMKIEKYKELGRFEPWLFRIAINRLRDEMRRRRRQAQPMVAFSDPGETGEDSWLQAAAGHAPDPAQRLQQAEQLDLLRRAVDGMSEADRQILHLRHTAGLSFAQIASTLEQPLGTVLARGHRALAKLRKMLGGSDD